MGNLSSLNWVTKSNELIEKTYQLSIQEQRIILTLASMVQPTDEHFKAYRFKVTDFVKMLGLKGTGKYNEIKDVVTGLQTKMLPIYTEKSLLMVNWLSSAEYFHGEGYVELEFSPKLKPYFLQLKEKFTSYQLKNVIQLRSSYSIRIYELLKQYEAVKTRTFEVEEFKRMLGIEEGKYKQFGHFKNRVLIVAQRELQEKTDINFKFKGIKKGRKVAKIKIDIYKNTATETIVDILPIFDTDVELQDIPRAEWIQKLLHFGISEEKGKSLIDTYDLDQIKRNLNYVQNEVNIKRIHNVAAYTVSAIKYDYELQAQKSKDVQEQNSVKDNDREKHSLEEKQKYFLENNQNLEEKCLQIKRLHELIASSSNEDCLSSEIVERYRMEIKRYLYDHIIKRKELCLPNIDVEDFADNEIRQLFKEIAKYDQGV